ncbi:hypothetical protein CALVIDRAFT_551906 [Calocera viscosa TUFC12733]|uniref:F-box domain-containing protein n=1 Tax=Calocera viscosa (strain TUFC12733) TaxID=1330018 RepID=A0A167S202_CALVF|nr:hypothetical protein CALVIDRAFT_551906 [Calocera viscosa TUFC12733]
MARSRSINWVTELPTELWLHMFELWLHCDLPFANILCTCRSLYVAGRPYLYCGVEFFWDEDGTLVQYKTPRCLPADDFVLSTAGNARILRDVTIHGYRQELANSSVGLSVGLKWLQALTLCETWVTQEVLTMVTALENVSSLHLHYCHINMEAGLSQIRRMNHSNLQELEIFALQFEAWGVSSRFAQKWASEELYSLMNALIGPLFRRLDFAPPQLKLSMSSTAAAYERLWDLTHAFSIVPNTLTHLRLRLRSADIHLVSMKAISELLDWQEELYDDVKFANRERLVQMTQTLLCTLPRLELMEFCLPSCTDELLALQHHVFVKDLLDILPSGYNLGTLEEWRGQDVWPPGQPKTLTIQVPGRSSHGGIWINDIRAEPAESLKELRELLYVDRRYGHRLRQRRAKGEWWPNAVA